MSKTKIEKVSVNEFEKLVNTLKNENYEMTDYSWSEDFNFKYKKKLTLLEITSFVDSVVNNCFINDDKNENPDIFVPYYKDLMIYKNVLEKYTNISVPSDIKKFYDWCMITNIHIVIISKIDKEQFAQIKGYIDESIEYNKQTTLANKKAPVEKMLCDLIDKANVYVEGLTGKFNVDAISKMIPMFEKIASMGKLDEKVLMQSWIDIKKEETVVSD